MVRWMVEVVRLRVGGNILFILETVLMWVMGVGSGIILGGRYGMTRVLYSGRMNG
jgi:hypothetical protein